MHILLLRILRFFAAEIVCFLPLESLDSIFQVLADRMDKYRRENKGYTPQSLFKSTVEIGLSYTCFELLIRVAGGGVMLKKRDASAQGWTGMKHIPGIALMPFENLREAQERLLKEVTDDKDLSEDLRSIFHNNNAYVEVHREDTDQKTEGRRVNCLTVVYSVILSREEISKLKEGFVVVPYDQFGDESIVDHHRQTLKNFK